MYSLKLKVKPQRSFVSRAVDLAANNHFAETGHQDIQLFQDAAPLLMRFAKSIAAMCCECGWNCHNGNPPWARKVQDRTS